MEILILSYALDTNGQNARFVKAARRHGDAVLKVFAIGKTDPAGVVSRLQAAAAKGESVRMRSAHRATNYLKFPSDILWTRKTEGQVKALALGADVIHLNNSEVAYRHFRLRKPALLHHHGSLFRNNPERMLAIARHYKFQQCVSTVDLQRPAPRLLPWLPTAYDVDELAKFGQGHARKPDGRIRIVHAPTNRDLKNTAAFLEAVGALQAEGLPIDLDLVEGVTWDECMKRKAKADIVFDQIMYGYGCNAIEAWGMGIPVIAGADEWTMARMASLWPAIPFEEATTDTIKSVIRRMVESPALREDAGQRGYQHVRRYHDEKPALEILFGLYDDAIQRHTRVRIPGKAPQVTFRKTKHGPVYFEDEPIPFQKGVITTDDPLVIDRLRVLAKRPARFGIEEVA